MTAHPATSAIRQHRNGFWHNLLIHDDSGVYAVEFALLAVPFFGILCAFCEFSYVDFASQILTNQVQKAGRAILVGTAQGKAGTKGELTYVADFNKNIMCPSTADTNLVSASLFPGFINCANLITDIRPATSWTGDTLTASGMLGSSAALDYCLGQPSTIVIVRVIYLLPSILPLSITDPTATLYLNPTDSRYYHVILGTTVLETEPYATSDAQGSCS